MAERKRLKEFFDHSIKRWAKATLFIGALTGQAISSPCLARLVARFAESHTVKTTQEKYILPKMKHCRHRHSVTHGHILRFNHRVMTKTNKRNTEEFTVSSKHLPQSTRHRDKRTRICIRLPLPAGTPIFSLVDINLSFWTCSDIGAPVVYHCSPFFKWQNLPFRYCKQLKGTIPVLKALYLFCRLRNLSAGKSLSTL